MKHSHNKLERTLRPALLATAVAVALGASPVQAFEFQLGEVDARLDTTISYGAAWRMEERDPDLVGKAFFNPAISQASLAEQIAAPGRFSVNSDDGNLNYDDGDLILHQARVTTELSLEYKNFGGFFRGNYFYDFENNDADFLNNEAKELVGERARLLDAYVYGDFDIGDRFWTVRLGRQVVSWGESTFIQGGINVINPVDVTAVRAAGAQLKDAFLPQNMLWTTLDITPNLAVEALYLLEWQEVEPDPSGYYFSTNDFATPGGRYAMLNFGLLPDDPLPLPGCNADPLPQSCFPPGHLPRAADRKPDDSGQYGLAFRYFADWLNDTEFGFYYLNYHSRLPLISGTTVRTSSTSSGDVFVEYPEDIHLFGMSFNSTIPGGIAFSGELSYRPNQPLQIDDVEVLFAGLSPLNVLIPEEVNRFRSQLGSFGPDTELQGWEEHEVSQLQFTFLKFFGPNNFMGADQITALGEIGATKVWDLPAKDVLRYNGPGTDTGGGPSALTGGNFRNPVTETDGFADDFSWGYRLAIVPTYNSVFGTPFNVSPRIAFNHDVQGTSPGPGGNFVEDRKTLTFGLGFNYLNKWAADISYTSYFGGGRYNLLGDRDFLSASISYSF